MLRTLKALVIDDSPIMRKILMQALMKTGLANFTFVEADDGTDALAKFNPAELEIVFVDWNLPTMNGLEFVENARAKIREQDEDDIPFVMVTMESSMGKVQEALDHEGVQAYVAKPFTVDGLRNRLKGAIKSAELIQVRRARFQTAR